MAPKRKNQDQSEEPTAREKKKLKVAIARTIAVQPAPLNASDSAVAGPSFVAPVNSLAGLPGAIDVEKFIEARAFEIDAMQSAIKTAGASATQRAWQALPRHLRRRAASHDVRRVPSKLREKARAEMDPVRKKALGRSMPALGRSSKLSRTESFLQRQHDKSWLETHIWHAKRMKMENMWGYRLAVQPTEKSYRPSHRASIHGSILHDASYMTLVEIKGREEALLKVLQLCCDPQGPNPGSKRYLGGSRILDIHAYEPESYPFGHIGPITVIWRPIVLPETGKEATKKSSNQNSKTEKGKEKAPIAPEHNPAQKRVVWLQFHPVIRDDMIAALKSAISRCFDRLALPSANVELADLKGQVNVFEIMGSKSSQVLKGALSPVPHEKRDDFLKFWSSLNDLKSSGSLPRGMVIGFKVNDPRLQFPPKNAKSKNQTPTITFPTSTLAASELWDEKIRTGLSKPKFKKKDLDERRSKNPIPGVQLNPLRQDNRVPVILIQRSLEQPNEESESIHGWTLIVPGGWSMAFFNSLVFTGTRVGGQRERQTQAYEAGTCYFPRDYPFNKAYQTHVLQQATEEKDKWNRKPPAKRVNFEKLRTRSPWKADWDVVLGLSKPEVEEFVTAQREGEDIIMEQEQEQSEAAPVLWLLRGPEVHNILTRLSTLFNHAGGLLSEINNLRAKRGSSPLVDHINASKLLAGALVSVKVCMCARGSPDDMAMIYSMDDDESRKSNELLSKVTQIIDHISDEQESDNDIPSPDSIIGYVTTGNYSLSRGEGFAIGAISLMALLKLKEQTARLHPNMNSSTSTPPQLLVKIRNRDSQECRLAYIGAIAN